MTIGAAVAVPPAAAPPPTEAPRDRRVIRLIALFKLAKAVTLVAVAAAAFGLLGEAARDRAVAWLVSVLGRLAGATEFRGLRGALGGALERALAALLHWLGDATPTRLEITGAVALGYALVLGAEGWGLWREKTWAELFSVAVTASLVPFELYELARRVTALRVAILVLNVAAVVYLARRVVRERRARAGAGGRGAVSFTGC